MLDENAVQSLVHLEPGRFLMNPRTPRLLLAAFFVLALSACSASTGATQTGSATGGAIEVAVSKTCTAGTDPKCVSVKGEHVVLPDSFEKVGVQDVSAADGQGPNTVDVTLTESGTRTFHALTEKAAQAGSSERLLVKIGGEVRAAVTVMQAIDSGHVQIDFSPDQNAQEAIDLIRRS